MPKKIEIPKEASQIISSGNPIFRIKQELNRSRIPNAIGMSEQPKRFMWGFGDIQKAAKLIGVALS